MIGAKKSAIHIDTTTNPHLFYAQSLKAQGNMGFITQP